MQIVPLLAPSSATGDSAGRADATTAGTKASGVAAQPVDAATAAADATTSTADTPASLRAGLKTWEPQLQRLLADAQQAADYLDLSAEQLQDLKTRLSAKLAGLQGEDSALQAQLQQVASTARARRTSSADSLDPQLRFSSPDGATQRFSVRGLNLQTLQSGAAETLAISVGGTRQDMVSVSIEPGLSKDAVVRRFDQALAPTGIRVGSDDSGALIFRVAESAWPSVRDSLSIKGGGIRFPTGQLNRVKTDAEPAALQPDTWQITDTTAARSTLQQVTQALDKVRQARAAVSRALTQASSQIGQLQATAASGEAVRLADSFQASIAQPGYQGVASVSAALAGISRSRVVSLLALPLTP